MTILRVLRLRKDVETSLTRNLLCSGTLGVPYKPSRALRTRASRDQRTQTIRNANDRWSLRPGPARLGPGPGAVTDIVTKYCLILVQTWNNEWNKVIQNIVISYCNRFCLIFKLYKYCLVLYHLYNTCIFCLNIVWYCNVLFDVVYSLLQYIILLVDIVIVNFCVPAGPPVQGLHGLVERFLWWLYIFYWC